MAAGLRAGICQQERVSSGQLKRMLGTSSRTAWHLSHRIRKTMGESAQPKLAGIVESDETYIGGKRQNVGRGYRKNKIAVQTIVQRSKVGDDGRIIGRPGRSRTIALAPFSNPDGRTLGANLRKTKMTEQTDLMTDENPAYLAPGKAFKSHRRVHHKSKDYAHTDPKTGVLVSTNSAEGFTGNLKRRLLGTHHSVSKKHLPRYLVEADHTYNERHRSDAGKQPRVSRNRRSHGTRGAGHCAVLKQPQQAALK